jgi:hypothetical protein
MTHEGRALDSLNDAANIDTKDYGHLAFWLVKALVYAILAVASAIESK